jgi:hypothetical protein
LKCKRYEMFLAVDPSLTVSARPPASDNLAILTHL